MESNKVGNPRTGEQGPTDIHAIGNDWHYHTIRDHEGQELWTGQYDLYPLWAQFGIPADLRGQTVLDIGTATGFFAFECEKRGAQRVVGTELPDIGDWDTRGEGTYSARNIPKDNMRDFESARRRLDSRVELIFGSINEPLCDRIGTFDWVIFGALLTHLRDPMLAMANVRHLTKKTAVVISSYAHGVAEPCLRWVRNRRPIDWWVPSKSVIPEMLIAAGFSDVSEKGDFVLLHKNGTKQHQACWHATV